MVLIPMVMVVPAASAATPTCSKVLQANDGTSAASRLRVPASSSYSTNCVMGSGNSSAAVGALQLALNYCYGAGLRVDNVFGNATKSALRSAQNREHINADGVYGPVTSTHLRFAGVNEDNDTTHCGSRLGG